MKAEKWMPFFRLYQHLSRFRVRLERSSVGMSQDMYAEDEEILAEPIFESQQQRANTSKNTVKPKAWPFY